MSPEQTIAHYRITTKLGEGGMGKVYRATDTKLNRDVAIKVLPEVFATDPDRLARFTREAQVLASLNHPNIAIIHGVESSNGSTVLVMELVEGATLAERIAQGPIPAEEALTIARQIAEALEAAHDRGIVHRDLKPANIKITPEGRVKVLDFGLATAPEPSAPADPKHSPTLTMRATQAGVIMGTAGYMSPEQASGLPVDKRADIWSFGVVLWEMLTGHPLFEGETVSHTLADVLRADINPNALPASTPAVARTIVRRCLDRKLKTRLRDIGEARIAIDDYLANPTAAPVAETKPAAPTAIPILWIAAAAVFGLALGGLAFVHFREKPEEMPLIRSTIGAPEKAQFTSRLGAMAAFSLSPDGQRIAFVAGPKDQLWIRPLNSFTAQPLEGTDGASYPFWSPDSRTIGFGAEGKLKRIEASGGPAITIASTPTFRGGTWSSQNIIVFTPDNSSALQRISASGGTASPATKLDGNKQELGHRFPWFLPDGRHFLVTANVAGSNTVAVKIGSLDSLESTGLFLGNSNAIYASGHLLFLRDSSLMAQPFDPSHLTLSGEAAPIAEKVGHIYTASSTVGIFSASSSGLLAYATGDAFYLALGWIDRQGKRAAPFTEGDGFGRVSLSPDQKHAAVTVTVGTNTDIWMYDLERNGLKTRFTFDAAQDQDPIWSPDGRTIIFSSNRKGAFDLYRKNADGTGADEVLYADKTNKTASTWSPDGKFLLYSATGSTQFDIWVLPLTSDPSGAPLKPYPWLQTEYAELNPQFSPDGKWVAYQSNESGRMEVFVAPFPGPGGKRQISTAGGILARWRRDSKELYYIDNDRHLTAVEIALKGSTIEIGSAAQLFGNMITGLGFLYDVSTDGRRFLAAAPHETQATGTNESINLIENWPAGLKK